MVSTGESFVTTDTRASCDRYAWPQSARCSVNPAPVDRPGSWPGAPGASLNVLRAQTQSGLFRPLDRNSPAAWMGSFRSPPLETDRCPAYIRPTKFALHTPDGPENRRRDFFCAA